MKFQKIFILSIFLLCFSLCLSQGDPLFIGQIIDNETREPVPYATLTWVDNEQSYSSDGLGNFRVKQGQNGSKKLKISALGYQSKIVLMHSHEESKSILLQPVTYQMPAQDIVIAEQILKKAFSSTTHLLEKPFTLETMVTGVWNGLREIDEYKIQALTELYFPKNHQEWEARIKEKRNLAQTVFKDVDYGYWLSVGLWTLDKRTPPCKLNNQKCWDKKLQTQYVKTSQYDGKKVYIISLKMEESHQKYTEASPFGASAYETEYVIDASNYYILRQISHMKPSEAWGSQFRKGVTVHAQIFTSIRNFRPYKDKYYLASLKTICAFETKFEDGTHEDTKLEHELVTTRILPGPKHSKSTHPERLYSLFDFEKVPFRKEFWEKHSLNK